MKRSMMFLVFSLVMVAAFGFVTSASAADTIKVASVEPFSGTFKDVGEFVSHLENDDGTEE